MGWFDWVPTIEETADWAACRLVGHSWENGRCKNCGKKAS